MHKKSTCEQRVGILTFCQYYMAKYIFQTFMTFSQPTGGMVELVQYVYYLRLPYSLSGVFSYQPLTLLIRVGYPQTYISMESL